MQETRIIFNRCLKKIKNEIKKKMGLTGYEKSAEFEWKYSPHSSEI